MDKLPQEIYDMITSIVEFENEKIFIRIESNIPSTPGSHETRKERLSVLRLVNWAFCESASRRLFEDVRINFRSTRAHLDRNGPIRMQNIAKSSNAKFVRQLSVDADLQGDSDSEYLHYSLFLQDMTRLLPLCISYFCGLTTLSIGCPPSHSCNPNPGSFEVEFHFIEAVLAVLHSVSMPALHYLDLSLFSGWKFSQNYGSPYTPGGILIQDLMTRITSLDIRIIYTQATHLAAPTMHAFLNFIQNAKNIKSLSLGSDASLDLEDLNLDQLNRLETLYFGGVQVSHSMILRTVHQNRNSLYRISFHSTHLKTGTWEEVLREVSQTRLLASFSMSNCGYTASGESSLLAMLVPPHVIFAGEIATTHEEDHVALAAVRRLVTSNRKPSAGPEVLLERYGFWS